MSQSKETIKEDSQNGSKQFNISTTKIKKSETLKNKNEIKKEDQQKLEKNHDDINESESSDGEADEDFEQVRVMSMGK